MNMVRFIYWNVEICIPLAIQFILLLENWKVNIKYLHILKAFGMCPDVQANTHEQGGKAGPFHISYPVFLLFPAEFL